MWFVPSVLDVIIDWSIADDGVVTSAVGVIAILGRRETREKGGKKREERREEREVSTTTYNTIYIHILSMIKDLYM